MNSKDRLIDAKVSILQLANELKNISKACKTAGIARSSFYEIKKAYEQFGRDGLEPKTRRKPRMPNEIAGEVEAKVLDLTRENPSYSYNRIADQLQLLGISISGTGVRKVWARHDLCRKLSRYLWLEREVSSGRGLMTEQALKAVNRLKRLSEATDNHVEANEAGELISQDLYLVGTIKGVGRIYSQSAVDCSNSLGFARLCLNKLPINSVALIHEKVLPFYDSHGIQIGSILTDCGREYCGRADSHFYEIYLASQGIKHRTTRPASPFTNGFVERFHRTLKDEFFSKVFRQKIYQLQQDLDAFLVHYNEQRTHSGYRCQGRTPMATFKTLLAKPKEDTTAA